MTAGGSATARLLRACALAVTLALLAGCALAGASREEVRAFLDSNYVDDPGRRNTWISPAPVEQTADRIGERIDPRDRFSEDQAVFMRNREYAVAVFPEASGSRIEFDDYDRIRRRYPLLIGGYWGLSPTSYGPRGERASRTGGGFRGGGPGFGK